jgi:prolyl 4-hydroxylase
MDLPLENRGPIMSGFSLPSPMKDILPPSLKNYSHDILCTDPLILRLNSFLTAEECAFVIDTCRLVMKKCETIGATNRNCDEEVVKIVRNNSSIMWMKHGEEAHPTISGFLSRIKDALRLNIPPNNELMQVHMYEPDEMCEPHHDYYEKNNYSIKRFGQRLSTILIYLNNVEAGGNTNFPRLNISIPARRGDVILFHNVRANGETDPRTLHSGEKVLRGYKWVAIKVINEDITNASV